ncbi:MAG: UDP-N-acetylmuramoyl-tripeptide--D-alanyl-D-alanine ligase [Cyclobacteriaceae bacterium]
MDNFIEFLYSKFLQSDGVSIDTRSIAKGNLFFALKGPNFNGNKYAQQSLDNGAAFAVVDEEEFVTDPRILLSPISGFDALERLAVFHRERFKRKVVAITGSNGKTTTKELTARVLAEKYTVHATKGNLNNHLGVPLTILHIHPQVEVAIIEMGANHVGEIAGYCKVAQPDYGLITNIGEAHTETFGGIEGVLRGKSELFDYLRKTGGTPFINQEDLRLSNMAKRFSDPILFPVEDLKLIGANPYIVFELAGKQYETNLIGVYNFGNVAAAVSVGRTFEIPDQNIAEAIASYLPENQRSQVIVQNGVSIILDAYNANPTSMKAALDNLEQIEGEKSIVLGDMKEVQDSEKKHEEVGKLASQLKLDKALFVGEQMKYAAEACEKSNWFESMDNLSSFLEQTSFKNQHVLVKASRSMKLESIIEKIH